MLSKWLSELRALLATLDSSSPTGVAAPNATGQSVPCADVSGIPTVPENGSSELVLAQKIPSEASMRDVMLARTERALAEAIQLHAQVTRGDAGILTNYVVIAETVDANLDNETDKRSLQLLTSPDCTPWALVGFSAALSQSVWQGSL